MGINYFRNSEVIEITIRDYGKKKIETHSCNINDSKKAGKIMQYLKDKYGFTPTIDLNNSINFKDDATEAEHDKDIDWWS